MEKILVFNKICSFKETFLLLFSFFIGHFIFGQDLIQNGDFETSRVPIQSLKYINTFNFENMAASWYDIDQAGHPYDLYSMLYSKNNKGYPLCQFPFQKPRSGNNMLYVTIVLSLDPKTNRARGDRNLACSKFKHATEPGAYYRFKCYVSVPTNEGRYWPIRTFGYELFKDSCYMYNEMPDQWLKRNPATWQMDTNRILTDTSEWVEISDTIQCNSEFNFISIGNFLQYTTYFNYPNLMGMGNDTNYARTYSPICLLIDDVSFEKIAPPLAIDGDTEICANKLLDLRITGGFPGYSAYLYDKNNKILDFDSSIIKCKLKAGRYHLRVNDSRGDTLVREILINQPILPVIPKTLEYCDMKDKKIEISNNHAFSRIIWQSNKSGTSYITQYPETKVTIDVLDSNYCLSSDSISISRIVLTYFKEPETQEVCYNKKAKFNIQTDYSVQWFRDNDSSVLGSVIEPTIDKSKYFKFEVFKNSCILLDSVFVKVIILSSPNIFGSDTVCSSGEYSWKVGNVKPQYRVNWSSGNNSESLNLTNITSGKYFVYFDSMGCLSDTSFKILVKGSDNPHITLTAYGSSDSALPYSLYYNLDVRNITKWNLNVKGFKNFSPNDNSIMPIDHKIIFYKPGEYDILAKGNDNFGCYDSSKVHVIIDDFVDVFIPSSITPNNDGLNDYFKPVLKGVQAWELIIHDRWGQILFKQKNIFPEAPCWKPESISAINGVFAYSLKVTSFSGQLKTYEGTVEILK